CSRRPVPVICRAKRIFAAISDVGGCRAQPGMAAADPRTRPPHKSPLSPVAILAQRTRQEAVARWIESLEDEIEKRGLDKKNHPHDYQPQTSSEALKKKYPA